VTLVVVAAVSAAAGAVVEHSASHGTAVARPTAPTPSSTSTTSLASRYVAYEEEIAALGIDVGSLDPAALHAFGVDECAAARRARSDGGAALLKFKADHVAAAYNANDQLAIETFRTLFIATGHLVCLDVETTIRAASRPLL
jgi:hypothetical protein